MKIRKEKQISIVSKSTAALLCLALAWTAYIFIKDTGAFFIAIIITPPLGVITLVASRSRVEVLKYFSLLFFFSNAIGAPLFWINRNIYSETGWTAVGRFSFDVIEFFEIYIWLIALYFSMVVCVLFFDKISLTKVGLLPGGFFRKFPKPTTPEKRSEGRLRAITLVLFILFVLVPLNTYMSIGKIGIVGLVSEPLPFRLVGAMYYFRALLAPAIITILYARTNRSGSLTTVICLYALLAGIASAGRSVFLLSLFPVLYFSLIDGKLLRVALTSLFCLSGFIMVSLSRNYTYYNDPIVLSDALAYSVYHFASGDLGLIDGLNNLTNRLHGAQDMVLAFGYSSNANFTAFTTLLLSGDASYLVPNIARDLYGIEDLPHGFGVGIGTMAYLLMASHSNPASIPLSITSLSFLIFFGNRVLDFSVFSFNRLLADRFSYGMMQAKSFAGALFAFWIYAGGIQFYYLAVNLIIAGTLTFLILASLFPKMKKAPSQSSEM